MCYVFVMEKDEDNILSTAVDGLLAEAVPLPTPGERVRLRKAAGLSQQRVADAFGVRRETVAAWESSAASSREPQGERRTEYARMLHALAERFPAAPAPAATVQEATDSSAPVEAQPSVPTPAAAPAAAPRSSSAKPARKKAAKKPEQQRGSGQASDRFADGPLVVLDGDGTAYGIGGQVWECPATSVPGVVAWALQDMRLGTPRLHDYGMDADPLVVLTAAGAERLGLPLQAPDVPSADGGPRLRRLPDGHPVLDELAAAHWRLTRRGFGPWARIYRPPEAGFRQCVQLCVLPWGALDERAWPGTSGLPAPELARTLGSFATRVITPGGTDALNGLDLMTALRPPTQPKSAPMPGSLTHAVDPAPPEAPNGHPLAADRDTRNPDCAVDEETYNWTRDPETLTDGECELPYAVGLDVNAAFLAAANRLTVGLGAPEHVTRPKFNKSTPGCWLVDLSYVPVDPRLPSPFTPDGRTPTGPAWYETPTVAYAVELGAAVEPLEAWLYRTPQLVPRTPSKDGSTDPNDYVELPASGGYLDPWYKRLQQAYLTTMEQLGVDRETTGAAFLDAMQNHKDKDPAQAAVLAAIKATAKGGIGKLAEGPIGRGWRPGQHWSALERPTWRPHIRYTVISQARIWMHRRMQRMADHGHFPLGVLSDCVVYPSPGPSPLDLLPTEDGKPAKGVFPLGAAPGRVKHEGTQPMLWAVELMDQGGNPAQFIKADHDAVAGGGE